MLKRRADSKIEITIDKSNRQIKIEDNGIGIQTKNVQSLLGNIAQSTKNRYTDRGFRGIGRLGGLGYCDKLTYETSYSGEKFKSIMIWDAKTLRSILSDPNLKVDAAELISVITSFSRESEDSSQHYFKVILDGVGNDDLLNEEKVRKYLSMVAPVSFNPKFPFSEKIYEQAKKDKVDIDEYNVEVNGLPLYKGYKKEIYKKKIVKEETIEEIVDRVYDVVFFKEYYNTDLIYWGWYGITENMQQIPPENNEKFIRLRKGNIQIGLETRLDEFHKKDTGNRYFIGEVHAIHKDLTPNGRRDFFIENPTSEALKVKLKDFFHNTLYDLYYDFSKKNSAFKIIDDAERSEKNLQAKINQNISQTEVRRLSKEVGEKIVKASKAKERLYELYTKYENKPLAKIITDHIPLADIKKQARTSKALKEERSADGGLNPAEKKLLDFILDVIRSSESKRDADRLTALIKREIKNKYEN